MWIAADRLREICVRWGAWWDELRREHDAHSGVAMRYRDTAVGAIRTLKNLEVNLPPFRLESEAKLIAAPPDPLGKTGRNP